MTLIATPKIVSMASGGPGVLAIGLESVSREKTNTASTVVPDPLDLDTTKWQVNGATPSAIHRESVPWYETPQASDGTVDITTRHTVYLTLPKPFQDGSSYAVVTPYGTVGLTFSANTTLARCIKVNQASYAKIATTRFANLGVWRGDGGPMALNPPPTYQVIRKSDGTIMQSGAATAAVDDTGLTGPKSGEQVHRLDLSAVPEGGPYIVSIQGIGCSHPFYVGGAAERNTAAVALRTLTIARCGQELKAPWSSWNRAACHPDFADTRVPYGSAEFVSVPPGATMLPRRGGYHDAGDYDIRPTHAVIPILLLTYLEAWPERVADGSADLPESGNGRPDLLDEALWGVLGWESLQIADAKDPQVGGVRSGFEQGAHPTYAVNAADHDRSPYGTWGVDGPAGGPAEGLTAYVAGIFAQASRLVRPYDAAKADDLLRRARLAWTYHASHNDTIPARAYNLYGSLQLYLATGESAFHDLFKAQATAILINDGSWPHQYRPGNFGSSGAQVQTVHFASYALPTSQPVDAKFVDAIKARVIKEADSGGYMGIHPLTDPYPVTATKFFGWGGLVRMFDAPAFASIFTTDATKRQQYINMMSLQADGILGLNGMGMSYVVGLGVEQPNCPGHLDSYYAEREIARPITGVMVYGPQDGRSGYDYQRVVTNKLHPEWDKRPVTRRYVHGWSVITVNEDSVWEVRAWFAALWAFLRDASKDPKPTTPPPPPDPLPADGVTLNAEQTAALKRMLADAEILRGAA